MKVIGVTSVASWIYAETGKLEERVKAAWLSGMTHRRQGCSSAAADVFIQAWLKKHRNAAATISKAERSEGQWGWMIDQTRIRDGVHTCRPPPPHHTHTPLKSEGVFVHQSANYFYPTFLSIVKGYLNTKSGKSTNFHYYWGGMFKLHLHLAAISSL